MYCRPPERAKGSPPLCVGSQSSTPESDTRARVRRLRPWMWRGSTARGRVSTGRPRLCEKRLHRAYRCVIVEEDVATSLDAPSYALAIFAVAGESCRDGHVFFRGRGNELLQPHALENAARQSAAQEAPLDGDDRQGGFHRLHRGVKTGEADGIEQHVCALQQSVE